MSIAQEALRTVPERLEKCWKAGLSWARYRADEIREHEELWDAVYRRSDPPEWALRAIEDLDRDWKLLAIAEDWCGDASNLVPVFVRLAEASQRLELRILRRDEHPELMDRYLTNGSRSIPIVVVLDDDLRPVGRWGPRPAELQEFVLREKRSGERPSSEIYRDTRRWYARDRGESTLRELVDRMAAAV